MMQLVKKLVFLVVISFFSLNGMAQKKTADELSGTWSLIHQQDGLSFYVSKASCEIVSGAQPYEYVFVKVVNGTASAVSVQFNLGMQFDNNCYGCETGESTAQFQIPANASVENSCSQFVTGLHGLIRNYNLAPNGVFQSVMLNAIQISK